MRTDRVPFGVKLYQELVFRSFDLFRGRSNIKRLHFLRESQYWPKERLLDWQLEKVNALLEQAKANSPFHRRRLANVRLPLKSLGELEQVPILTKDDIRKHREE